MEQDQGVEIRGASATTLKGHPFWPVIQHAFRAIVAVNQDRAEGLRDLVEGSRPVLLVSDDWACHCSTSNEIVVSTAVVEAMWAASYAYYLLYKALEAGHGGDLADAVAHTPGLDLAMKVHQWSLERPRENSPPWPDSFPRPVDPALGQGTSAGAASEFALVCLAFLLLHEIGHFHLGHRPEGDQAQRLQDERDADNFASDWMMDGKAGNERAGEKMRLGIVMACGFMVGRETIRWEKGDLQSPEERTHPWSYSRLFDLIDRSAEDVQATSWRMAVAVLSIHILNIEIQLPSRAFNNCREAANALVDVLAETIR